MDTHADAFFSMRCVISAPQCKRLHILGYKRSLLTLDSIDMQKTDKRENLATNLHLQLCVFPFPCWFQFKLVLLVFITQTKWVSLPERRAARVRLPPPVLSKTLLLPLPKWWIELANWTCSSSSLLILQAASFRFRTDPGLHDELTLFYCSICDWVWTRVCSLAFQIWTALSFVRW